MIWDRKSTSFIDNSMIIHFTTKASYYSTSLVYAPLHQAPSAPLSGFSSKPSDLFLGSEWVLMEEEGKIGEWRGNSHKMVAITWGKEGMSNCLFFVARNTKLAQVLVFPRFMPPP
jgi:hypothetical protein